MQKTLKLGTQTGSVFNHLMSSNSSEPVVNEGATILLWTDRHAYTVIKVSEDKKACTLQRCKAKRIDNLGMSDMQSYDYSEHEDYTIDLVYRNNAWRTIRTIVEYINYDSLSNEQKQTAWDSHNNCLKVVEDITKAKKKFDKVSIIFGVRREYYDYSL